jgi:hypothetical protein
MFPKYVFIGNSSRLLDSLYIYFFTICQMLWDVVTEVAEACHLIRCNRAALRITAQAEGICTHAIRGQHDACLDGGGVRRSDAEGKQSTSNVKVV